MPAESLPDCTEILFWCTPPTYISSSSAIKAVLGSASKVAQFQFSWGREAKRDQGGEVTIPWHALIIKPSPKKLLFLSVAVSGREFNATITLMNSQLVCFSPVRIVFSFLEICVLSPKVVVVLKTPFNFPQQKISFPLSR